VHIKHNSHKQKQMQHNKHQIHPTNKTITYNTNIPPKQTHIKPKRQQQQHTEQNTRHQLNIITTYQQHQYNTTTQPIQTYTNFNYTTNTTTGMHNQTEQQHNNKEYHQYHKRQHKHIHSHNTSKPTKTRIYHNIINSYSYQTQHAQQINSQTTTNLIHSKNTIIATSTNKKKHKTHQPHNTNTTHNKYTQANTTTIQQHIINTATRIQQQIQTNQIQQTQNDPTLKSNTNQT